MGLRLSFPNSRILTVYFCSPHILLRPMQLSMKTHLRLTFKFCQWLTTYRSGESRIEIILLDNNRKIWKRQPPKNNFYGKVFFSFFGGKLEMSGAKKMDRYWKYIDFRLPLVEIGAMRKNMQLNPLGDGLAFLAMISWGCYSALIKKIGEWEYPIVAVTRRVYFYGILFLIPVLIQQKASWKSSPISCFWCFMRKWPWPQWPVRHWYSLVWLFHRKNSLFLTERKIITCSNVSNLQHKFAQLHCRAILQIHSSMFICATK